MVKADFTQAWTSAPSPWTDEEVTDYPAGLDWSTGTDASGSTVTNHGTDGHTVRKAETSVVVSEETDVKVNFQWSDGSHSLWVLGVDLIDAGNNVIKSDYALKQTSGAKNVITYTLSSVPAGTYTMRYFICDKNSDHEVTMSSGTITVEGKVTIDSDLITSAADLSNNKVYSVSTKDRGSWIYSAEKNALTSTQKVGTAASAEDVNQQFAFITVKDKVYLYSVGAQKFIVKSEGYTTTSSDPTEYVELLESGNVSYPVVVALNGSSHMGISNGYDPAVITHYNSLSDAGNQINIAEAKDMDLTTVISAIELYLNEEAQELIAAAEALYNSYKELDYSEITDLGAALEEVKEAFTDENIEALEVAYNVAKEYPFIESTVRTIEPDNYYIYYTDENGVKHYLQTAGSNSVVTVTEGAKAYAVSAGVTADGKFSKAYYMEMNNLRISNTNSNGTLIETKALNQSTVWTSQVVFEKDGKCAIRLTNTTAMDQWHGYFFIGKGEAEGATIALDPATSLEEAMFIWTFEKKVTETLGYTLTDALGNAYTGTYEGVAGEDVPVLSGVAGYTLSNEAWNGTTYTANIAFPFPVSNAETTNSTMISNFNAGQRWHAVGGDVKVQTANPVYAEKNDWLWAIYPKFENGSFTFTVKNVGSSKFVTLNKEEDSFDKQGTVTLTDNGTDLEVITWLDAPCFKVPGKTLYLTINGAADTDVYLATWTGGNNGHGGNKLHFAEFVDVTGVTLDQTTATIIEKQTLQLTATVTPDHATSKTVTWSTSNDKVATVDENGLVTTIADGQVIITAATGDKTAECVVTVIKASYAFTLTVEGEEYFTQAVQRDTELATIMESVTKPADREGYTFSGWDAPATMPANDLTLDATYIVNKYTVIFKIGEDVISEEELDYGAAIVAPDAPSKEGYTFSGWGEVAATVPVDGATYEGSYTVNKYTVIFKIGDEVISSEELEYGAAIEAPDAPSKEGYTFNGWGEVAATVPVDGATYEGSYTVNKYTVSYYFEDGLVYTAEIEFGAEIPEYIYDESLNIVWKIKDEEQDYTTMPAKDLVYVGELDTTGLDRLPVDSNAIIYDIHGRRVLEVAKGLYVINGKKVFVK